MAVVTLNAQIWFAQYRLTTDHNRIAVETGYEEKDGTVFGDTAKRLSGTTPFVSCTGGGFVTLGTGQVHAVLRGNLNVANVPVTISPAGGADGGYAETFLAKVLQYQTYGPRGELMPFSFTAKGQGVPSVNGTILGVGSKTATANGTARQLGAVSATQKLYAALHVISVSGSSPTLDVVLGSDNAENFASSTSRLTFAQKVAAGSEWSSVAGAITDDWWRAVWTIGGTGTPTFDVVIVAGIF